MAKKTIYGGKLLDQRAVVKLKGKWYWLMYEHQKDDYLLMYADDKGKPTKLVQAYSPQVAYLGLFDKTLTHENFGHIEEIKLFTTSSYALNWVYGTGTASHTTIRVPAPKPAPKVVTKEDIEKMFGKDIVIKL